MSGRIREVQLPADLCEAAEKRFGARFGSLETFLTQVLSELLRDDGEKMDQQEQALIEQRLKDLGYT